MLRTICNEAEITTIISTDKWMMDVLKAAEELNLNDWWIGAGFLRNKIWNYLEGKAYEPTRDVDLVYFNNKDISQETDWAFDNKMNSIYPFADWEIRNQARMHYKNNFEPFSSTADGITHWTETATAVAVKIKSGSLEYLFCYGTEDLFNMVARPTPYFRTEDKINLFSERVNTKQWQKKWPSLKVVLD